MSRRLIALQELLGGRPPGATWPPSTQPPDRPVSSAIAKLASPSILSPLSALSYLAPLASSVPQPPPESSGGAPDVIRMVVREPGLLTADYGEITRRLLEMKVGKATSRRVFIMGGMMPGSGPYLFAIFKRSATSQPMHYANISIGSGIR